MKILLISLKPVESLTSAMFRNLAVAHGLYQNGCMVDILTVPLRNVHEEAEVPEFVKEFNVIRTESNRAYDKIIGQNNERKTRFKEIFKNVLRKIWHTFSIYDYTYTIAKQVDINILPSKEYDIIISSSDPKTSHIAAKSLIKDGLECKKWIQYWGDPLAIDITNKSIYPKFVLKIMENNLLKGASKIVYVSPFTMQTQKELFKNHKDIMCYLPIPYMERVEYEEPSNLKFVIGYYGAYPSNVRDLRPFYEACVDMGEDVQVEIYGDSDLNLESTSNVKIYPRGIVEHHKKKANLLVCVLNKTGTQIPGKLFHLAGTNKPILVIVDGELKDNIKGYLNSFNRFYLCENSKEDIKSMIYEIMHEKRKFSPSEEFYYKEIARRMLEEDNDN